MTRLLYYSILMPISLLPHQILYLFSDLLYLLLYRLIGYRKKVVLMNLRNSFPEKKEKELTKIMKDFYRHLCDIIIEGIKGFTISEKEIRKRMIIINPEISNFFANQGKNICFVGGHYNNWEICAQAFPIYSKHQCIGIYKPLSNTFLNKKLFNSRSRYGLDLINMMNTKRIFKKNLKPKAIIFGSDQNPSNPKKAYWLKFLNQDTGVLFGVEKYSKEYKCPVIFVSIQKKKRGYYEAMFSLITEKPEDEPYGKITTEFTKRLEIDIIKQPEYWLWTHKRWKHKRQK